MDLTDYDDLKEFYMACLKLHQGEEDPELMFEDWEYIPEFLVSESSLHDDTYTYMEAYPKWMKTGPMHLKSTVRILPAGQMAIKNLKASNESYQGHFGSSMKDSGVKFACQYIEDTGMLSAVPDTLQRYFDYDAFAGDLWMVIHSRKDMY